MKKLLLILALLAYAAISCEKPLSETDEPNTEQPSKPEAPADSSSNPGGANEPEDTIAYNADTCSIFIDMCGLIAMVYNVSADDVDFEASINSVFKHFTITLKDGSLPSPIGYNCRFAKQSTFDSGYTIGFGAETHIDSLARGEYLITLWEFGSWGPDCYPPEQRFLYREIVLNEQHASDSVREFDIVSAFAKTPPLVFTNF